MPTSSIVPTRTSERGEIDQSLETELSPQDSEDGPDVPSPKDSSSPPPSKSRLPKTPSKPAAVSETSHRTPISALKLPLPSDGRGLAQHRSLQQLSPSKQKLHFGPPPKRAKATTPRKQQPQQESEDSFADDMYKVAPRRRLTEMLEGSRKVGKPEVDEIAEQKLLLEQENSTGKSGEANYEIREETPGSPSSLKSVVPPALSAVPNSRSPVPGSSADSDFVNLAGVSGSPAFSSTKSLPAVSTRPSRFAPPSQDESDPSPSKRSHLFSSQTSGLGGMQPSQDQETFSFQATQFNRIPHIPSPPPRAQQQQSSSNSADQSHESKQSDGTSRTNGSSGQSPHDEATQLVSEQSQQRTADYQGGIQPGANVIITVPAAAITPSPVVVDVQPHRRLGRRPLRMSGRPSTSLPNQMIESTTSIVVPSPNTVAAPEMPDLEPKYDGLPQPHFDETFKDPDTTDDMDQYTPGSRRAGNPPENQRLPASSSLNSLPPTAELALLGPSSSSVSSRPLSGEPDAVKTTQVEPTFIDKDTLPPPANVTTSRRQYGGNSAKSKRKPMAGSSPKSAGNESEDEPIGRPSKKSRKAPEHFTPTSEQDEEGEAVEQVENVPVQEAVREDELLLKRRRKEKPEMMSSPSPIEENRDLSDPETPPDPENSDFESFHPTKISARGSKSTSNAPTRSKRISNVSAALRASRKKADSIASGNKRSTWSSIDSTDSLSTSSSAMPRASKHLPVFAYWGGKPPGWYAGYVKGKVGVAYLVEFDDKSKGRVSLESLRRRELRTGERVWAVGPKVMKRRGELVIAEDWGLEQATAKAGPKVNSMNGGPVGRILPKNIFFPEEAIGEAFNDRTVTEGDFEFPTAGPSSITVPTSRMNRPVRGKTGIFTGKTFLVTAAAHHGHAHIDNLIKANGGTVKSSWEDLFTLPASKFGSTLRRGQSPPFVAYVGSSIQMNAKFMVALAAGIPCLSSKYIDDSLAGFDVSTSVAFREAALTGTGGLEELSRLFRPVSLSQPVLLAGHRSLLGRG